MPFERPLISIAIAAERCAYSVRFNDVPIWIDPAGRPVVIDALPVNEWMISDSNRLSVQISPLPGRPALDPGASCAARLEVTDASAPAAARFTVTTVAAGARTAELVPGATTLNSDRGFEADLRGDVSVGRLDIDRSEGPVPVSVRRTVRFPWTFPKWRWLTAAELLPTPSLRNSLIAEYGRLWRILEQRDRAALIAEHLAKIGELGQAYYLDRVEAEQRLGFEALLADPEITLFPLMLDDHQVEIFAEGRVVRLANPRGYGPLVFVNAEQGLAHYVDVAFCLEGQSWRLIR